MGRRRLKMRTSQVKVTKDTKKKSKRRQVNKSENKPINNTNPSNERFYPEL